MDLVKKLQSKGFELKVDGNRLLVAPKDKLTPELTKLIEQNVKAIIKAMQDKPQQKPTQQPQQTEQPTQPKHKPYKNLTLTQLTALISKGIPEGSFIVVDFEGVNAAVCKKENEQELQERGLTTLTPKELAALYLSNTDKETFKKLLEAKRVFGGYVAKVEAV